jgi:hypothetical protein
MHFVDAGLVKDIAQSLEERSDDAGTRIAVLAVDQEGYCR